MALMLAIAGLLLYSRVSHDLNEAIDEGLRSRADDVAALAREPGAAPEAFQGSGLTEPEEGFAQIVTPDGRVVEASTGLGSRPAIEGAELARAREEPVFLGERPVPGIEADARILAVPATGAQGQVIVAVGSSTEDRDETLAGLAGAFAVGGPLALLLASGAGYLLATAALSPIEAMRRRAEQVTLERREERLPLPAATDEVRRLGETLNAMLERLAAALTRERTFVADASHELRGPLAVLKAELEIGQRQSSSPAELRAVLESASEETDRLAQLAEDLLVVARLDEGRLPVSRREITVAELLDSARERFARRAHAAGRRITVEVPASLRARIDPLRAEQAVGNLLDNALRYGEGDISVTAQAAGGLLEIRVSDHGPGFPAGFAAQAFDRFTRADAARTRGGTGLGLSIVDAIARAHGGTARVDESEGGGAVLISLPLETS